MVENFYGDVTMSENSSQRLPACPAVGSQTATICLPVSIKPFAVAGKAKLECCGPPVIAAACKKCRGVPNGKCDFTISQTIRVDLPVEFGATVSTGETFVDCCHESDIPSYDCGKLHAMMQELQEDDGFPCSDSAFCDDCPASPSDFGENADSDVSKETSL